MSGNRRLYDCVYEFQFSLDLVTDGFDEVVYILVTDALTVTNKSVVVGFGLDSDSGPWISGFMVGP